MNNILTHCFLSILFSLSLVSSVAASDASEYLENSYRYLILDDMSEYTETIKMLTEHIIKGKNTVHALNNRAVANREIGKVNAAIKDLKAIIELGPINKVPYINMGDIYLENKDNPEEAIKWYTAAIKRFPNDAINYRIRAYAYLDTKQWKSAIRDFDIAIRLDPSFKKTYLDRAEVKEKAGDSSGAKADRATASKLQDRVLWVN